MTKIAIHPQKDTATQLAEAHAAGLKFDSPLTLKPPVSVKYYDIKTKTWVVSQE
jgi:hypothetical protein